MGRVFTAEDDRLGVELVTAISHDLWVNHLGRDPNILGRSIKLSDCRYTVIGVMPAGFNHEAGNLFWLPAVPTLDPSTKPSIRALTVVAQVSMTVILAVSAGLMTKTVIRLGQVNLVFAADRVSRGRPAFRILGGSRRNLSRSPSRLPEHSPTCPALPRSASEQRRL